MNREQRRRQAKRGGQGSARPTGERYADVLAKRRIGQATLKMAMEDQAVALAADIKCQQMLWTVIVALNELYEFGPKRTRDVLEAAGKIAEDFEAMKESHGYEYAEEKLRQRASQVSGVDIRYQHENERLAWEKMKDGKEALCGEGGCGHPPLRGPEGREGGRGWLMNV